MLPSIAILTDFGNRDPYVGIMKGVIKQIYPQAQIIDLTHEIPPGDIARGAFVLWQSHSYFPAGTTFLVVVDPGVGTARQPIFLQTDGFNYIGPDNGIFSYVLGADAHAWGLENPKLQLPDAGNTFHGRDIFAPAAAHAARGVPGPEFGSPHLDFERLPQPKIESPSPGELHGQILHADHFGNLITSLGQFKPQGDDDWQFIPWVGNTPPLHLSNSKASLRIPAGTELPWVKTFAQLPDGQPGILVGSTGLLEIVANRQSAANLLNLGTGDPVILHFDHK